MRQRQLITKIYGWIIEAQTTYLIKGLNSKIYKIWIIYEDTTYIKTQPNWINPIFTFLKKTIHCQYTQLIDIIAVDIPKNILRFSITYILLSLRYSKRIYVNVQTNELIPLNSVSALYDSANISEREIWDLFGIFFSNNFDLRRILTDYGFKGHPLRKSFPLTGFEETSFNNSEFKLNYTKVILAQQLR